MRRLTAILAGGEGRRMGGAKPLRPFGDTTLIGRALELAQGYGGAVAIAVRDPHQVGAAQMRARLIRDEPAIEGPLAGLAAALVAARDLGAAQVLTLPCDAPDLPADLALRLQRRLARTPRALAAVARCGGRLHPVCALWRTEALERLTAYLETGSRSLRGFAEACEAVWADWPAEEAHRFEGANTPEELAALQTRAAA